MGSPLWEPYRSVANEKPHRRIIPRSFALMTKPVTVAQWQQFLKARPDVPHGPEADEPIIEVSWFMAAQYCNWLSAKEGLPPSQWCYPEKMGEQTRQYPDHLRRKGYRLPTEAEWEYACRAGAATSRYYGSSLELLPRYSWFIANSSAHAWPVGQKRPNDLGLFDMHGNVLIWCQDPAFGYPSGEKEDKEDMRYMGNRILRGSSFNGLAAFVRSGYRLGNRPANRFNDFGVRVARTYD
jgi:formylglycine-generating enzyme required for sulfatase activity